MISEWFLLRCRKEKTRADRTSEASSSRQSIRKEERKTDEKTEEWRQRSNRCVDMSTLTERTGAAGQCGIYVFLSKLNGIAG